MSVKISLGKSKKKDSQDGRNTDNELQRSRSAKNNKPVGEQKNNSRRKLVVDGNKCPTNLSYLKENKGRRYKRNNP